MAAEVGARALSYQSLLEDRASYVRPMVVFRLFPSVPNEAFEMSYGFASDIGSSSPYRLADFFCGPAVRA